MPLTNVFDMESQENPKPRKCFGTVREVLQTLAIAGLAAFSVWNYTVIKQNTDDITALESAKVEPKTVAGSFSTFTPSLKTDTLDNAAFQPPQQWYTQLDGQIRDVTVGNRSYVNGTADKPEYPLSFHFIQDRLDDTNETMIARDVEVRHTWTVTETGSAPPDDTHTVAHTLSLKVYFDEESGHIRRVPLMTMEYVLPEAIADISPHTIPPNAILTRSYINQTQFENALPSNIPSDAYRFEITKNSMDENVFRVENIRLIETSPTYEGIVYGFIITGQYNMVVAAPSNKTI